MVIVSVDVPAVFVSYWPGLEIRVRGSGVAGLGGLPPAPPLTLEPSRLPLLWRPSA
jgi:hypothetical protein